MTLRKNVASQKLVFSLVNASTGAPLTGATVTAKLSIDGGSSTTASGAVTELANGQYLWSPSQADTNGTMLGVQFTATGAVPAAFTIYTTAADPTDSVRLGLTALPNAAADAAGGLPISDAGGLDLDAKLATATSALATAANLATAKTAIDGIKAVTDAMPDAGALTSLAQASALATAQADLDTLTGADGATLATSQPHYAPAKAGDAMTLSSAYDAAKTAATQASVDTVDGNVDAIKERTDNLPDDPADESLVIAATDALATAIGDVPTNAELTTALAAADDAVLAAIAALSIPTAAANAAALLDLADGVETGLTPRQAIRLIVAAAAGKLSGAATTTITIRNAVADSKDRVIATVDSDGNRTAITTDLT